MGARKKKAYTSGEAANYVTRTQAIKDLQLTLKDFRRLCILKGIHPREPRNRKRAQKGNMTTVQTLFHEKDIRFLKHEQIVWKFRDLKVFLRKVKKAEAKKNYETLTRLKENRPKYTLDHIVKERYPTFIDAIRDLEDCLCLCFLYSSFPRNRKSPVEIIELCRKLTVEFMHYVIESRSLKKVFVSIKGYYYQAEIMGQTVTWIVPHSFSYEAPQDVDIQLMSIFVEFYTTMLGFVNFRLYHNLNLVYPPTLPGVMPVSKSGTPEDQELKEESSFDLVMSLSSGLVKTVTNVDIEEVEIDDIPMSDDLEKDEAAKKSATDAKKLRKLFEGCKFFLNREVPRESLVFMIRSFGGEVSWEKTLYPGSTFDEDHSEITHQICDRESVNLKHIGRYYIQPQWVFDSINQIKLLPVHDYFIGKMLPPHLSPFISDRRVGDYIPPEEKRLLGLEANGNGDEQKAEEKENSGEEAQSNEELEDEEEQDGEEEEEEENEEDSDEAEEEQEDDDERPEMSVEIGKAEVEDKEKAKKLLEQEEFRLRKMMIPKKHKGLYRSMMKSRKRRVHESKQLERKRKEIDSEGKRKKVKK